MLFWTSAFMALTAATVYLAWRSRGASRSIGGAYFRSAAVVAVTCFASNLMVYLGPAPHMQFFPMMDGLIGAGFMLNWSRTKRLHHLALALLFAGQGVTHVWYFNLTESTHAIRYAYDAMLNAAYVAQLLTVAVPSVALLSHRRRSCRSA